MIPPSVRNATAKPLSAIPVRCIVFEPPTCGASVAMLCSSLAQSAAPMRPIGRPAAQPFERIPTRDDPVWTSSIKDSPGDSRRRSGRKKRPASNIFGKFNAGLLKTHNDDAERASGYR
jgi:hypothetical protein